MNSGMQMPRRHPSDAMLLAYASGSLGHAHRIVVATQALNCATCRSAIHLAERVGGLLLDDLASATLRSDALKLCLAQLRTPEFFPDTSPSTRATTKKGLFQALQVGDVALPETLQGLLPENLRWLAPGIRHATLFQDDRGTLHLIRVRPNVALPAHMHCGLELTCVLKGSFHDGGGQYLEGDLCEIGDEAEEQGSSYEHQVTADPSGDCVCIMAISGRMRFRSWVARLLKPLLPF